MLNSAEMVQANRLQPFTFPVEGDVITSASTGIDYRIGARFDEGGFGTVFECTDSWGDDLVAKILKPIGSLDEMEARANDEVLASNMVRSPHIGHVRDAFIFWGAYYIIAERCTMTLREMMADRSINGAVWFPHLGKAILHALHYMHTRGLAYCDVHPGNVFLYGKTDVILPASQIAFDFKLGDFGQTRPVNMMDARPSWNANCLPPELLLPKEFGPVDHRADLYQVGLLFLRFLSGAELKFSESDVIRGHPRELAEALVHPAAPTIATLLRRHAECRPLTALEAYRQLANAIRQQS